MDNSHPLVSVIIPTFNRKEYLAKALASVFVQTHSSFEVIVIDDASTDGTLLWLKREYPQVSVIASAVNRGASHARNQGILQAKGKYIAFLDSDDTWKPQYLARQVEQLEKNPKAVLSWSDCLASFDNKMTAVQWRPLIERDVILSLLVAPFIETMSCVVVRTDAVRKTELLNEGIVVSHDNDLYLQLCRLGEVVNLPDLLVVRDRQSELRLTGDMQAWAKDDRKVVERFFANKNNADYKHLEKDVWSVLEIRDRLRVETNFQLMDLWGRRMKYKLELKHDPSFSLWRNLFLDIISILAFIKQQFLGLRRPESQRFSSWKEKIKHLVYLNQRLWDPFLWTLTHHRS